MNTRQKGNIFEHIARSYLLRANYKILETNVYGGGSEIDIVALKSDEIIFIEVKGLQKINEDLIYGALTKKKAKRLNKAVKLWLYRKNKQALIWQVDFIGIIVDNDIYTIEHFKNILI